MEQETENTTVAKPFYEYQVKKELVELRDLFVTLMASNSYEPADATRLDSLLELAYVGGKVAGLDYATAVVKGTLKG
jgi:hypothetical protein